MALKFNSVESIAIKEGLIGDVYEGTKGEVDDFVINALSNYYPIKIVKRFIFRPLLGRWYPYIDVKSPGYSTQLSLFFGKLNMSFSLEKTCSVCGTELTFKNSIDNYIPLGLCEKCLSKLHYNYWYCLNKVYNEHNSIDHSTQTPKGNQICENLLLPSCGFPMVSEKTNPCLKNHGIGLVITDNITLKIIIGTLDTLKYKIIRGGGLIGIILGYSDRIMNIEILGRIFKDFLQFIRSCAKEFNDNTKFSSKNFDFFQETVVKVAVNHDNLSSINESKESTISWWFLINFLRYYGNYGAKVLVRDLLRKPIIILKFIVAQLLESKIFNFEILGVVEIFKFFSPVNHSLRDFCEKKIQKNFKIERINDFWPTFRKYLRRGEISNFSNFFDLEFISDLDNIEKELEIKEVLTSLGSCLVIDSNLSKNPIIICIDDLIGRTLF